MLDALGISTSHCGGHAQSLEKGDYRLVTGLGLDGEPLARISKENGPIGLSSYQPVSLQPLHRTDDRHMRDPEVPCQISCPCLAPGRQQVGNRLYVVLRSLLSVLLPGTTLVEGALIADENRLCRGLHFLHGHPSLLPQDGGFDKSDAAGLERLFLYRRSPLRLPEGFKRCAEAGISHEALVDQLSELPSGFEVGQIMLTGEDAIRGDLLRA